MRLGISDSGYRRLSQEYDLVSRVVEAGRGYEVLSREYDAVEEISRDQDWQLMDLWEAYTDAVEAMLFDLISGYEGCSVLSTYSSFSKYFDISYDTEDESDSITVRVSNHKQKYSGPVWSFEVTDDENAVRGGLVAIKDALEEMIADVDERAAEGS